jgi:hypothetical protein
VLSKAWIDKWAKVYDRRHQEEVKLESDISTELKKIGSPPTHLTLAVLKDIAKWKAHMIMGYIEANNDNDVKDITQVALTTHNERLRLEALRILNGVNVRMASAILWFCFQDKYSVMDRYAWKTLQINHLIDGELKDTFEYYEYYNKVCGDIVDSFKPFGITRRTLDKALWQFGCEKCKYSNEGVVLLFDSKDWSDYKQYQCQKCSFIWSES